MSENDGIDASPNLNRNSRFSVIDLQFDRGYLSPYFVTDPERMEVVLENPVI